MVVEFEQMPSDARVWIYQSDRDFTIEEARLIDEECKNFLHQWAAHRAALKSSAILRYNRFLIISVDEKQALASGCSIDSSVHFVQDLGEKLGIDFFNRLNIGFLINDKVHTESVNNIRDHSTSLKLSANTMTFDNTIQNKLDLQSRWLIPVSESWLNRYFVNQNA